MTCGTMTCVRARKDMSTTLYIPRIIPEYGVVGDLLYSEKICGISYKGQSPARVRVLSTVKFANDDELQRTST